jgi:HPt (histidine-containing phosphotransfer) domain-containing protein
MDDSTSKLVLLEIIPSQDPPGGDPPWLSAVCDRELLAIDPQVLRSLGEQMPHGEFLRELYEAWVVRAYDLAMEMRRAAGGNDLDRLCQDVASLKRSSEDLGVPGVTELCAELERSAGVAPPELVGALIEHVAAEIQKVAREVHALWRWRADEDGVYREIRA